jgi:predicted RNA-binding Zn-ribbon protein involved in translation (DUF1610 family)
MNQDPSQLFPMRWQTLKPWLTTIAVIWLLGFVGLGWLVKSFLFFIGFVTLVPIVGFFGLQWWLTRNLLQGSCPVCQENLTALKRSQTNCPNCGETLMGGDRGFERLSTPGTIDVQAVEVVSQVVDDDD